MNKHGVAYAIVGLLSLMLSAPAQAGVVTFTDREAFLAAAGDVQVIDFETLPDGSPSVKGTPITPDFNYTDQGVTFSSPFPNLTIADVGGEFALDAQHPETNQRNWIITDFAISATAVGIQTGGGTTLKVYDSAGELVAPFEHHTSGAVFLGLVSNTPFDTLVADRGASFEAFQVFYFTSVPEPATFFLVAAGITCLIRRRMFR